MGKNQRTNKMLKMMDLFTTNYPKAFFGKDSPDTVPLATGINWDLRKRHPDLSMYWIGTFLQEYTTKNRYLRALISGKPRVDLDGNPCGEVKESHRSRAAEQLATRESRNGPAKLNNRAA